VVSSPGTARSGWVLPRGAEASGLTSWALLRPAVPCCALAAPTATHGPGWHPLEKATCGRQGSGADTAKRHYPIEALLALDLSRIGRMLTALWREIQPSRPCVETPSWPNSSAFYSARVFSDPGARVWLPGALAWGVVVVRPAVPAVVRPCEALTPYSRHPGDRGPGAARCASGAATNASIIAAPAAVVDMEVSTSLQYRRDGHGGQTLPTPAPADARAG